MSRNGVRTREDCDSGSVIEQFIQPGGDSMRDLVKVAAGAAVAAGLVVAAPSIAGASGPGHSGWGPPGGHLVFVQTDNTSGNDVVVYDRGPAGNLTWVSTNSTDGLGGALQGAVVDHLASQGSLVYDSARQLLYGVNAGSNTFYVFRVNGDRLTLLQDVTSGGSFPVSIAARGNVVYVLNAEDGGSVAGFRWGQGGLRPIPGSTRDLGLATETGTTTQFTHTPGQIAFSTDGSQLIVTTKAGGEAIDVFRAFPDGSISATPVVNTESGQVPFAVAFGARNSLLVANAGPNSVSSFALGRDGTLTELSTADTTQSATCWISQAQGFFYLSNAGSSSLSTVIEGSFGQLSVVGTTSSYGGGTVDAAASPGGQFLYVQNGASGIVDEFSVGHGGVLSQIGYVKVAGAVGGEGIAAS
jgi:6-phosphogluconolactonase (cycloisomerase 2 family)